jgi:hypothetical protein
MSTTDDQTTAGDAGADLAAALRDATFVHVVAHADGDALAAAGLVARALGARDTPYQVTTARTAGDARRRVEQSDAAATVVALNAAPAGAAVTLDGGPVAATAHDAVTALADAGDPALALAGVVAGGGTPEADAPALLDAAGERRPGVAVPTQDLVDGLAHATLVHAEFSGNADATAAALAALDLPAELDRDARRRLASLVAVEASADHVREGALERALHPVATGRFETVGGYADVLGLLARTAPGTATALALGHDVRTAALDAWRDAAAATHRAVREADPARHAGLVVADVGDAPAWPAARLLRDFRSPEPAALAVAEGGVALAAPSGARTALATATEDDAVLGRETLAYARTRDPTATAEAVREAM